ncbi:MULTISPECIES: efflux RND transporter periplasmic adaptor subunit [Methylomonas]|uniref:Efflux transporter periplasmic adaptor subunit n=1 Tax=Methylomonas denitrificans TaxID=1538553 RepID=A0A126T3F0_9GAMM|nr:MULTISPECIES: efflux RND transporter periplasmic adaptor subunit [Methylomonas]AMK76599.1 efflux transporter periplasmic adaptor subunit [Methylomonas denitrificans]OAH97591.1 efflux transporter periplasmic adaptor subunit [Methylomonas methanica]
MTRAVPQWRQWPTTIEASGPIAAWQEAVIGAQQSGLRLIEVNVNVGDQVKRGQLLARFDADMLRADLAQLQANLAQAQATAVQAETNKQRVLKLKNAATLSQQESLRYETEAEISRTQVDAIKAQLTAKQLQLGYAEVRAPDDGAISARLATLGAVPGSGQELFRLIRQNRLEWRGELTAGQIAQIQIGQAILLSLPDGSVAQARVRQLAPALDEQSRLGLMYADILPGSHARAGMYANGRIELSQRPALTVPAASLVIRDGRSYVLKLRSDADTSPVSLQAVDTGRRQGVEIEIVQGLSETDRVVVEGAGFLNDGDLVHVAPAARVN